MKRQKRDSFYQKLTEKLRQEKKNSFPDETIDLGGTIRRLRHERKLTGVGLCRKAGNMDPKTLTAVEKGRIQNPSIRTLLAISKGLGVPVADLFSRAQMDMPSSYHLGSQKGAFYMDFPGWGIKVVSLTPFIKDFFCGKLIFEARRKLDQTLLPHSFPLFISTLVGRFQVTVEEKTSDLKEGDNLFFNGSFKHIFYNPLHRESVLMLVTAPSFF